MVDSVIFWAIALFSVGAALGAVLCRSIIHAALCLIVVFLSIAGVFVLNNADFLAIAQVIIYAVGLTIIMLFAIMFTGDKPLPLQRKNPIAQIVGCVTLLYMFGLLLRAVVGVFPADLSLSRSPEFLQNIVAQGSTTVLGSLLFKAYALPFEIASILLLVAMIGSILIAKKRFTEIPEQADEMRFEIDRESAPSSAAIEALRSRREMASAATTSLQPLQEDLPGDLPEAPELVAGGSALEGGQ